MVDTVLAMYSLVLSGMSSATWFFAFEIRKAFSEGIFWDARRIIATSLPFFIAGQLVVACEAVYGSTFAPEAAPESFYEAGNPRAHASGG